MHMVLFFDLMDTLDPDASASAGTPSEGSDRLKQTALTRDLQKQVRPLSYFLMMFSLIVQICVSLGADTAGNITNSRRLSSSGGKWQRWGDQSGERSFGILMMPPFIYFTWHVACTARCGQSL
jgi:hypothetical protein